MRANTLTSALLRVGLVVGLVWLAMSLVDVLLLGRIAMVEAADLPP